MKIPKKHIILGIICLASAFLQNISGIAMLIPYLAFCFCSFVICLKSKRWSGSVAILLTGLIVLPVFELIYSMITASLMTTLFANALILLLQTIVYFCLFILVNSWLSKERFSFSLTTGILAILCVAIYSVLESVQMLALTNVFNQGVEQGTLFDWLSAMGGGNLFINVISKAVFYIALWCTAIRFVKEK
ncbi:MAG: hypothetical protein IJD37_06555 [Clostridia bacterium]|nr:hypothetical protein [Clostridia bacterium]